MLRQTDTNRIGFRVIAVAAAFAILLFAAHSSEHWHDEDCADELCAICLFSDPGSAASDSLPYSAAQFSKPANAPVLSALLTVSRPFADARPRAPPVT